MSTTYLQDTLSTLLGLLLMGEGLHNNDWGDRTNDNLLLIEGAISGVGQISGLTGGTTGLTLAQSAPSVLVFTGALAANQIITVPAVSGKWLFDNETTGAFTLSVTTPNGTGVPVGQGSVVEAYCDGMNVKGLTTGSPIGTISEYYGVELADTRFEWANGQALLRTNVALFNAITRTTTLTVGGGATACACTEDLSKKGLVGATVEGPGIPSGTTVTAITSSTVTLSNPTTGGAAQQTIRLFPYGNGDGSTTFNVPNRCESVAVGASTMGGAAAPGRISTTSLAKGVNLGALFGEDRHALLTTELASHTHAVTDPGHAHGTTDPSHAHGYSSPGGYVGAGQGGGGAYNASYSSTTSGAVTNISINTATTGISVNMAGGGTSHNNLQPGIGCNYIIRAR